MKTQKIFLLAFLFCTFVTFVSIFLPWAWGIAVVHSSQAITAFKVLAFIFALFYFGCITPNTFWYGISAMILNVLIFGIGIHDSIADISTYGSMVINDSYGVYVGELSTLLALTISILALKSGIKAAKAVEKGDYTSAVLSSEEALEELKKSKEKRDLELISEDEFNRRKSELAKFID